MKNTKTIAMGEKIITIGREFYDFCTNWETKIPINCTDLNMKIDTFVKLQNKIVFTKQSIGRNIRQLDSDPTARNISLLIANAHTIIKWEYRMRRLIEIISDEFDSIDRIIQWGDYQFADEIRVFGKAVNSLSTECLHNKHQQTTKMSTQIAQRGFGVITKPKSLFITTLAINHNGHIKTVDFDIKRNIIGGSLIDGFIDARTKCIVKASQNSLPVELTQHIMKIWNFNHGLANPKK